MTSSEKLEKRILTLIKKLGNTDISDWNYDSETDLLCNKSLNIKCNVDDTATALSTKFYINDIRISMGSGTDGSSSAFRTFLSKLKMRLAEYNVEKVIEQLG